MRLFCIPYAGGTASVFAPWAQMLDASIELVAIQLPGRANRMFERPYQAMEPLVRDLTQVIRPWLGKPYALYGHSLGSRIAIELAQSLQVIAAPVPQCIIASGSRAPHIPRTPRNIAFLPEAEFIQELRQLNGTPEEILRNHELMQLHMPMLRADFRIADSCSEPPTRSQPGTGWVFAGEQEPDQSEEELLKWGEYFEVPIQLKMFPGGHFFLETAREQVVAQVNAILTQSVSAQYTSCSNGRASNV